MLLLVVVVVVVVVRGLKPEADPAFGEGVRLRTINPGGGEVEATWSPPFKTKFHNGSTVALDLLSPD
jgi:hypothetical protein